MDLGEIEKIWVIEPETEPAPIEMPAPQPQEPVPLNARRQDPSRGSLLQFLNHPQELVG